MAMRDTLSTAGPLTATPTLPPVPRRGARAARAGAPRARRRAHRLAPREALQSPGSARRASPYLRLQRGPATSVRRLSSSARTFDRMNSALGRVDWVPEALRDSCFSGIRHAMPGSGPAGHRLASPSRRCARWAVERVAYAASPARRPLARRLRRGCGPRSSSGCARHCGRTWRRRGCRGWRGAGRMRGTSSGRVRSGAASSCGCMACRADHQPVLRFLSRVESATSSGGSAVARARYKAARGPIDGLNSHQRRSLAASSIPEAAAAAEAAEAAAGERCRWRRRSGVFNGRGERCGRRASSGSWSRLVLRG